MIPFASFSPLQNLLFLVLFLWTLPWKIYGLWLAAKRDHKTWFVAMILLNTVAILEIYYIFKVAKKSAAEVKADFKQALWSSGK